MVETSFEELLKALEQSINAGEWYKAARIAILIGELCGERHGRREE